MAAGGTAIGFADLWALRHNHPGHRTDGVLIDRPPDRVAKPAKRGNGSARRRWKKTTTPAATVDGGGEMRTNVPQRTEPTLTDARREKEARTAVHVGRDRHDKKTPAAPPRWGDEEASKYEEEEEAGFVMVGGVRCRTVAPRAAEEGEAEFILVGGVLCRTVAPRARKAAVAGGITVGRTNMRGLLCGNGPGQSADLVDGRKHKKVAAVVVHVEETPPTASVAKKHETAPASVVNDGSKVQTDGAAEDKESTVTVPDGEEVTDGRDEKETAAVSPGDEEEEATGKQEEEAADEDFIDVVTTGGSHCPTVARRTSTAAVAGGITVGGANMWAALCDHDPGHRAGGAKPAKRGKRTKKNKKRVAEDSKQADAVEDVDDIVAEEVAAAAVVEVEEAPPTASVSKKNETAPAGNVDGSKVRTDGAAEDKEDTVPDVEEVTDGREEKETAAVSPTPSEGEEEATGEREEEAAGEEMSKEEEGRKFIDVVTTGGSHCPTVARRTSTVTVAGGITVGGDNMWAALRDNDPGHRAGGAKPAKRGKKTKKNKKRVAEESEQAATVDDGVVQISSGHEEEETPAELPSNVEEEEDKTAGGGAVATGGSRCRAVAGTICRAAVAATALFALWCDYTMHKSPALK